MTPGVCQNPRGTASMCLVAIHACWRGLLGSMSHGPKVTDCNTAKIGLLQPLPAPTERFTCYNMDFVFGLPLCKGVNRIMTMLERATKRITLLPVHENVTAAVAAVLFLQWVFWCYRMPQEVISDWNPSFMSVFWQQVFTRLSTTLLHSTAHHP